MPVAADKPEDTIGALSLPPNEATEATKQVVPSDKDEHATSSAFVPTENASTPAAHLFNADAANNDTLSLQASASEVGSDEIGVDPNVSTWHFPYLRFRVHQDWD